MKKTFFSIFILVMIIISSCSTKPETTMEPEKISPNQNVATKDIHTEVPPTESLPAEIPPTDVFPTEVPPTEPPITKNTEAPTQEIPTETPKNEPIPPEPQLIEFEAEDGQNLLGTYYPSENNHSPLIVLMHWAPGDQNDWLEIAYWFQNRGLGGNTPNPQGFPWLDSTWFPQMFENQSFAVFSFTFRYCEGGCSQFDREGWLMDAEAAMNTARNLDGIDPNRIIGIGASIGADGVADGCYLLNRQYVNSCLGALSLSPGHYLTIPYEEAVNGLEDEEPQKPAWCVYANEDPEAAPACQSASGDNFLIFEYPGNLHGMQLIDPSVEPDVLNLMLDFIKSSLDL